MIVLSFYFSLKPTPAIIAMPWTWRGETEGRRAGPRGSGNPEIPHTTDGRADDRRTHEIADSLFVRSQRERKKIARGRHATSINEKHEEESG